MKAPKVEWWFVGACVAVVAVAFVLGGCATQVPCPSPPEPKVVVQQEKVPVPVDCLGDLPAKPQYEPTTGLDDGDMLLALTRNWLVAQVYEARMEAAALGCTALPKAAAVKN